MVYKIDIDDIKTETKVGVKELRMLMIWCEYCEAWVYQGDTICVNNQILDITHLQPETCLGYIWDVPNEFRRYYQ